MTAIWICLTIILQWIHRGHSLRMSHDVKQRRKTTGGTPVRHTLTHTAYPERRKPQEVSWWCHEKRKYCSNFFSPPLLPVCPSVSAGKKNDWEPPVTNSTWQSHWSDQHPARQNRVHIRTESKSTRLSQAGEESNYLMILLCSREIYKVSRHVCERACACIDSDSSSVTG